MPRVERGGALLLRGDDGKEVRCGGLRCGGMAGGVTAGFSLLFVAHGAGPAPIIKNRKPRLESVSAIAVVFPRSSLAERRTRRGGFPVGGPVLLRPASGGHRDRNMGDRANAANFSPSSASLQCMAVWGFVVIKNHDDCQRSCHHPYPGQVQHPGRQHDASDQA